MITSAVLLTIKIIGVGAIGTIASSGASLFHQANPFKTAKKGANNNEIESLRQRAKQLD